MSIPRVNTEVIPDIQHPVGDRADLRRMHLDDDGYPLPIDIPSNLYIIVTVGEFNKLHLGPDLGDLIPNDKSAGKAFGGFQLVVDGGGRFVITESLQ